MNRKILCMSLSLVTIATVIVVAVPVGGNGTTTQIIDPPWERTSNYILGDRGLRNYYGADPPGTWTWTNDAWNGAKSDMLYFDKVGPSLPSGYVFHSDQWFYTIDYDTPTTDPSTIYWFRTDLNIASIGDIISIRMFDKYSLNQPHIAVNDNIWVFVNGVYTQEARGTHQGMAAHINWNLAPTTGWVDDTIEIPLSYFQQGNNEVAILYQEMIEDGGLGHLVFEITSREVIQATIDIDPNTLNLKSKGKWITCYIKLPSGYDVKDIDATTILLEDSLSPELDPKYGFVKSESSYIMDHDGDGILERMVKFDRSDVEDMLSPGTYNMKVTGELIDGTKFAGYSDEIRVIDPPH